MKKISLLFTITIIAILTCLSGCSFITSNKFVGTWEYKSPPTAVYTNIAYITIEKKGEKTFIVNHYSITPKGNLGRPYTVLAELKEDILVTPDGKILDINDDKLTFQTKEFEYRKIDKNVLNYDQLAEKVRALY